MGRLASDHDLHPNKDICRKCRLSFRELLDLGNPTCFKAKFMDWTPTVKIPKDWKGPSLAQRAKDTVEGARANGLDPVHVGNRWV